MLKFTNNSSVSKVTILIVVILLMILSAGLLHYLSKNQNHNSNKKIPSQLLEAHPPIENINAVSTEISRPKQVKIILKVLPKNIQFNLSMLKPEVLSLAKSESSEVQLMVDEGIQYTFKITADNKKEEIIEIKPSGQIEVHYVHF